MDNLSPQLRRHIAADITTLLQMFRQSTEKEGFVNNVGTTWSGATSSAHNLRRCDIQQLCHWLATVASRPVTHYDEIVQLHGAIIAAVAGENISPTGEFAAASLRKVHSYLMAIFPMMPIDSVMVHRVSNSCVARPVVQPDFGRPPIGLQNVNWHMNQFQQVDAMALYKNANASRTSMHYQIVTLPLFQHRRNHHNVSCVNRVVVFREGSQVPLPEYVDAVKQFRLRGYVVRFEMIARSTLDVEVEVLGDTNAQRDCVVSGFDFSRVFGQLCSGHRKIDVMKELDNWLPQ